jgi:hypothetical protein
MRSSQAFIHARMRSCNTHHLHVWEHVEVMESHICFRNHIRCFKVELTPRVKSTRATTTLAGLQFLTPRKDVMNRSWSMWQLIFIWQAKSAQAIQAKLSTQTIITISSHRIWVWDITRCQDGKYGNTSGTRRTERSDSGSLDSTMRASSDVSEMRWSVHPLNTNEKQQNLYFVIIIKKMFDYFFIISYIL